MNLMYSCRRVAELLSQRLDEPLGWIGEIRLRLHLSMCRDCSNVAEQLDAVHDASNRLLSSDFDLLPEDLDSRPPPR